MSFDIYSVLKEKAGKAGQVSLAYGGFEVIVDQPSEFPWEDILRFLLALQHDVWVCERRKCLVIMSKPPAV